MKFILILAGMYTCKLSHLGQRNPARMHWKAEQMPNWAIFLRKWARRDRYSQWRSLSSHAEPTFVHRNWRGGYWQHLVSLDEATLDVLRPVFEDRIITREYCCCGRKCVWRDRLSEQLSIKALVGRHTKFNCFRSWS